jgi:uncharacterized protein (DUF1501 family)
MATPHDSTRRPNAPGEAFLTANGDNLRTLVVVFLRGGADGLSLVPAVGDADYHRVRPTIGISEKNAVKVDGFFGFHPELAPLKPAYDDGELAVVHEVGSEDDTRSHFFAQDLMEHGGLAAGGWLGRFLRCRPGAAASAVSAVTLGQALPESLRGAPSSAVLKSLSDFALTGDEDGHLARSLDVLYARAVGGVLAAAARDTLAALRRLERLRSVKYVPSWGATYDANDPFAQKLLLTAQLIKAKVGLEAVSIDLDGWDSHLAQETIVGPLVAKLAGGLRAFHTDLGPEFRQQVSVVVMTEFGRRVAENASFGTDHGRGSVMLVLGGGVRGGQIIGAGNWPGLAAERLDGPGDLPVVHNYRNVLAPVLSRHGADPTQLSCVFPNFKIEPLAL